MARVRDLLREYEEFSRLFYEITGTRMWGAQRLWARRLIKGKSFSVVAPTGSGKTTFGIVASIYMVMKRKGKVLFVLPTSTLAYDVYRRFSRYGRADIRVVLASSILPKSELEESMAKVRNGDFDVLIITSAFLPRHMDLLINHKFSLIFVDDVDSVLRASSRNVDRLLRLLGVSDELMSLAMRGVELIRESRRAAKYGTEEELRKIGEELRRIREELRSHVGELGILVVSGSLVKPKRSPRLFLFREFLGFETGGKSGGIRNVVDIYVRPEGDLVDSIVSIVRRLGDGGIIYVPPDMGKDFIESLEARLNEAGIIARSYLRPRRSLINDFAEGRINVLIGVGTSRSALVRGIDLPHRISYVVFAGVPRIKFRLRIEEFTPTRYLMLFFNLRNIVPKHMRNDVDRLIARIRSLVGMSKPQLDKVLEAMKDGIELKDFEKYAAEIINEAVSFASKILGNPEVRHAIATSSEVNLSYVGDELYVILPDVTTYLQGSGRTSRMYVGGVSLGLSVLVVDDEKLLTGLVRSLRLVDEVKLRPMGEVDIDDIMVRIRRERELIGRLMRGEVPSSFLEKDPLRTALMVVESPTKARTIASFFGAPSRHEVGPLVVYEVSVGNLLLMVAATRGHMWDLVPMVSDGADYLRRSLGASRLIDYFGVVRLDGEFIPIYNTIRRCPVGGESYTEDISVCRIHGAALLSSGEIVDALRDLATEVDQVLIGTDPDSEGEKIAWDVYVMLKPLVDDIMRVEFHEVTKRAILDALSSPRRINMNMVKAQLIRRIEDRWIGFGLSQRVQEVFGRKNLSAGRVQTPVLGWIIEREEESKKNKVYIASLSFNNSTVSIEVPPDGEMIKRLRDIRRRGGEARVVVSKIDEAEEELNPPPPYTTDALLRDAANILRMGVDQAMDLAQELFEAGLITYHRTDSTRVSSYGVGIAREYIVSKYGEGVFTPRTWGSEGAHECIRPTRPIDAEELRSMVEARLLQPTIRITQNHIRLYDLIFRRFMASQMRSARVLKERLRITLVVDSHSTSTEVSRIARIIEPGFLTLWPEEGGYRDLSVGEYPVSSINYIKRVSKVRLLREGDVIALMKERGIGRPSTYAKIVEIILRRGYAIIVGRGRYIVPTNLGKSVYKYLVSNDELRDLVNEERTRIVERYMDEVEAGDKDYLSVITELFNEAVRKNILMPREI